MRLITTFIASYIFIVLYAACASNNSKQIDQIRILESIIMDDKKNLNSINTTELKNYMKIAEINLLKLEKKQLDSITVELIYFQYRDYLNCINDMKTCISENTRLIKELEKNKIQLSNMKLDYQISNKKRLDLDTFLIHEKKFIYETSKQIIKLVDNFNTQNTTFDSLNKSIEIIINEN